jgi:glucose repression mediator protein
MTFHNLSKLAEFCGTKGDYHNAIQYYVKMSTLDPENGPSWTALGHCYLLTDDIHKAFNAYQHALYCLEDIKDPQLWYGIGILYEKFESYDHAISALVAVLKMSPNFYQKSEVLYKLGVILAKTNQLD